MGQGSLGEEGIAGEETDERIMLEQFLEGVPQRLRLGRLAGGDRELSQTEAQLVGENVEHMDRIAVGVMPLFTGLSIDGHRDGRQRPSDRDNPTREHVAKLLQGALGHGAADRRGVWGLLSCEAQRLFEDLPVIGSPTLKAGHVGLSTEQTEESHSQKGVVWVADPASLPGVVDLAKSVKEAGDRWGHP